MKEHNWEEPDETVIEIPTYLGLGNETFITASSKSAANGTSLTELCRRLEERLDSKRIELQFDMTTWISPGCPIRLNLAKCLLNPS